MPFSLSKSWSWLSSGKEPSIPKNIGNWRGVANVATGSKHLKATPPKPCQDAVLVRAGDKLRPCAFVADGAGSAPLSHLGANETVLRLSHLVAALEDIHVEMLDMPALPSQEDRLKHAHRFLIYASDTIRHLSEKKHPFKHFHCTLLAVIIGAERVFWIKIGDGHIVREDNRETLQTIGASGKGEYANVTNFIQENPQSTVFDCGLIRSSDISGIALMTDGAAEKLVSRDGTKVAGRVISFLSGIRNGEWDEKNLYDFLADKAIWKPQWSTGDDKGIALLSRLN